MKRLGQYLDICKRGGGLYKLQMRPSDGLGVAMIARVLACHCNVLPPPSTGWGYGHFLVGSKTTSQAFMTQKETLAPDKLGTCVKSALLHLSTVYPVRSFVQDCHSLSVSRQTPIAKFLWTLDKRSFIVELNIVTS